MIKLLGTLPSAIASSNTDTVLSIPVAYPPGTVPDAAFASVSVQNGTNATLTQIALTFTPIVGGIPLALAYPVTVSVAAGAATTVQVPLTNGLDEAPSLTLTFASAPTSGNCAARVVLMPQAPQVGLTGSLAPLESVTTTFTLDGSLLTAANTTYYLAFQGLHRNARRRLLTVNTWGNSAGWSTVAYASVAVGITDSSIIGTAAESSVIYYTQIRNYYLTGATANIAANYTVQWDSLTSPQVGAAGDTLVVEVITGTTAPSGGTLPVIVQEEV